MATPYLLDTIIVAPSPLQKGDWQGQNWTENQTWRCSNNFTPAITVKPCKPTPYPLPAGYVAVCLRDPPAGPMGETETLWVIDSLDADQIRFGVSVDRPGNDVRIMDGVSNNSRKAYFANPPESFFGDDWYSRGVYIGGVTGTSSAFTVKVYAV